MFKKLIFVSCGLAAAIAGFYLSLSLKSDFTTVEGQSYQWQDFKGQYLVVNYFAEWCAPCLKELPELNQFESFAKDIYVVNTSRGKVLDLNDLLESLQNGKVAGACLDVLENEKFEKLSADERKVLEKLVETKRVLFSPHVAGWTFESYRRISEVLAEKIKNHYLG